jgi:prevent-host-death family protein
MVYYQVISQEKTMVEYGVAQAKARLSELTNLVDAGEEVVITKRGRPAYRLVGFQTLPHPLAAPTFPRNVNHLLPLIRELHAKCAPYDGELSFVEAMRQQDRY